MPETKDSLKQILIEQLKSCVVAGDSLPYRRELDGDLAARAIDVFLDRFADLPPDWTDARFRLQNAIIECQLFEKDDDVQLMVNSDPTEYTITARIDLGAALSPITAGGDTPEQALQRLRAKLDKLQMIKL